MRWGISKMRSIRSRFHTSESKGDSSVVRERSRAAVPNQSSASREAQARYDLTLAQEIAAENDLQVRRLALDTLVGRTGAQPLPMATARSSC